MTKEKAQITKTTTGADFSARRQLANTMLNPNAKEFVPTVTTFSPFVRTPSDESLDAIFMAPIHAKSKIRREREANKASRSLNPSRSFKERPAKDAPTGVVYTSSAKVLKWKETKQYADKISQAEKFYIQRMKRHERRVQQKIVANANSVPSKSKKKSETRSVKLSKVSADPWNGCTMDLFGNNPMPKLDDIDVETLDVLDAFLSELPKEKSVEVVTDVVDDLVQPLSTVQLMTDDVFDEMFPELLSSWHYDADDEYSEGSQITIAQANVRRAEPPFWHEARTRFDELRDAGAAYLGIPAIAEARKEHEDMYHVIWYVQRFNEVVAAYQVYNHLTPNITDAEYAGMTMEEKLEIDEKRRIARAPLTNLFLNCFIAISPELIAKATNFCGLLHDFLFTNGYARLHRVFSRIINAIMFKAANDQAHFNDFVQAQANADFLEYAKDSILWKDIKELLSQAITFTSILNIESELWTRVKEYFQKIIVFSRGVETFSSLWSVISRIFEGGYLWFTTGDWRAFFVADRMTTWYSDVTNAVSAVYTAGDGLHNNEELQGIIDHLDDLHREGKIMLSQTKITDRTLFPIEKQMRLIKEAIVFIKRERVTSEPMPTAMGIQITGDSAIGKSSVIEAFVAALSLFEEPNKRPDNGNVFVFNDQDEFDSMKREGQFIAVIDDINSVKPEYTKRSAVGMIFRICNIIPAPATMADLADKGVHYHVYKYLLVTSNLEEMAAHCQLTYPAAFLRRMRYVVEVKANHDYCKEITKGTHTAWVLDDNKLPVHPNPGDSFIEYQFWSIGKREPLSKDVCPALPVDPAKYGFPLVDLTKHPYLDPEKYWVKGNHGMAIMLELAKQHKASQQKVMNSYSNEFNRGLCQNCLYLHCICDVNPGCANGHEKSFEWKFGKPTMFGTHLAIVTAIPGRINDAWLYILTIYVSLTWYCLQLLETAKLKAKQKRSEVVRDTIDVFVEESERRMQEIMDKHKLKVERYLKIAASVAAALGFGYYMSRPLIVRPQNNMRVYFKGKEYDVPYKEATRAPYVVPVSKHEIKRMPLVKVNQAFTKPTIVNPSVEHFRKQLESRTWFVQVVLRCRLKGDTKVHGAFTMFHFYDKFYLLNEHTILSLNRYHQDNMVMLVFFNTSIGMNSYQYSPEHCRNIDGFDVGVMFIPSSKQASDFSPYFVSRLSNEPVNASGFERITWASTDEAEPSILIETFPIEKGEPLTYEMIKVFKPTHTLKAKVRGIPGQSGSMLYRIDGQKCSVNGLQIANAGDYTYFTFLPSVDAIKSVCHHMTEFPIFAEPNVLDLEMLETSEDYGYASQLIGPNSTCAFHGVVKEREYSRAVRSEIRESILHNDVKLLLDPDIETKGAPIMRPHIHRDGDNFVYIDPVLQQLAKLATKVDGMDPSLAIAELCFNDYVKAFDTIPEPSSKGGPLSDHQALNRDEGFTRLNMNTAAGFPLKGKKKAHCVQNPQGDYEMKEETHLLFEKWREDFYTGQTTPLFGCSLKDEVKDYAKMLGGKVRVFNGSPFFFSIECRKYLIPFIVFFVEHREEFEHAIGINCFSTQFGDLYKYLDQFSNKIAGDFQGFDINHMKLFMLYMTKLFRMYCEKYTAYTEDEVMKGVICIHTMIHSFILIGREVFTFGKGMPSGCVLTLIMNTFLVSMYMRLVYFLSGGKKPFREENKLVAFGDDHILSTLCPFMGLQNVKRVLAIYGQIYTHSSKKDVDFDFEDWSGIQFLKRGFVPTTERLGNDEFHFIAAPLEMASIHKMLAFTDADPSEERHQCAILLVDAQRQWFMHGREIFEARQTFVKAMCEKHNIKLEPIGSNTYLRYYTYDGLLEEYKSGQFSAMFA